MSDLMNFLSVDFGEMIVFQIDGKPYFQASAVAKMLGYVNPHDAIKRHCRGVVKREVPTGTFGTGKQEMNFISEGDLYRLITHSKLPSAEKFERWVFDEVLPCIRRYGVFNKYYNKPYTFEQNLEMAKVISTSLPHAMPYVLKVLGIEYILPDPTEVVEKEPLKRRAPTRNIDTNIINFLQFVDSLDGMKTREAYEEYKHYCNTHEIKPVSHIMFSKQVN